MNSLFILNALITPGIGLIVWTTVVFILLVGILGKFAWKPILTAIKTREQNIENALSEAEKAKHEMKELKSANEMILQQARNERDAMLKDARDMKDSIISEAKTLAVKEQERILNSTREQIANEKNAAIAELKNQVAALSIEIAEKILKSELSSDEKQKALVTNLMKDVNLN